MLAAGFTFPLLLHLPRRPERPATRDSRPGAGDRQLPGGRAGRGRPGPLPVPLLRPQLLGKLHRQPVPGALAPASGTGNRGGGPLVDRGCRGRPGGGLRPAAAAGLGPARRALLLPIALPAILLAVTVIAMRRAAAHGPGRSPTRPSARSSSSAASGSSCSPPGWCGPQSAPGSSAAPWPGSRPASARHPRPGPCRRRSPRPSAIPSSGSPTGCPTPSTMWTPPAGGSPSRRRTWPCGHHPGPRRPPDRGRLPHRSAPRPGANSAPPSGWRWRTSAVAGRGARSARPGEASRVRIVETGDSERRRLERDLHDGAQQQLLALSYDLRLARAQAVADGDAPPWIAAHRGDRPGTSGPWRTQGPRPRDLPGDPDRGGPRGCPGALADAAPLPVEIVAATEARYPAAVETAAYLLVAEAWRTPPAGRQSTPPSAWCRTVDG